MEENIFDKIYQIMSTYDYLLEKLINKKNINKDTSFLFHNDNFFQFIFKNIHVQPKNYQNINKNKNTQYYQIENKNIQKDDINQDNIQQYDVNQDIKIFIKKCYKKIALLCHPDKTDNIIFKNYFIKCQDYYENNFIIGLLYLFYLIKISPPLLNENIIQKIFIEIRLIQEKIYNLQKSN